MVLEKTPESHLDCKEIKPVNPKGNQSWILEEEAEAEAPMLWPPDVKNQFTGKAPDAGKDWRQEEKVAIQDEVVGWHYWINRHEFELTPGDSEGQGSLVCCRPLGANSQTRLSNWTTTKGQGVKFYNLIWKVIPFEGSNCFHFKNVIFLKTLPVWN